jgi:hypothetical protein
MFRKFKSNLNILKMDFSLNFRPFSSNLGSSNRNIKNNSNTTESQSQNQESDSNKSSKYKELDTDPREQAAIGQSAGFGMSGYKGSPTTNHGSQASGSNKSEQVLDSYTQQVKDQAEKQRSSSSGPSGQQYEGTFEQPQSTHQVGKETDQDSTTGSGSKHSNYSGGKGSF